MQYNRIIVPAEPTRWIQIANDEWRLTGSDSGIIEITSDSSDLWPFRTRRDNHIKSLSELFARVTCSFSRCEAWSVRRGRWFRENTNEISKNVWTERVRTIERLDVYSIGRWSWNRWLNRINGLNTREFDWLWAVGAFLQSVACVNARVAMMPTVCWRAYGTQHSFGEGRSAYARQQLSLPSSNPHTHTHTPKTIERFMWKSYWNK